MYVSARGLGATSQLTQFQAGVLARAKRARGLRGMGSFCDDFPEECGQTPTAAQIAAAAALGASGACTCLSNGTCAETGNSCVPRGAPVTPNPTGTAGSITAWLNANAKTVGIAAAVGFGVLMLSGGRGRR